jgi:hypothetical protein
LGKEGDTLNVPGKVAGLKLVAAVLKLARFITFGSKGVGCGNGRSGLLSGLESCGLKFEGCRGGNGC